MWWHVVVVGVVVGVLGVAAVCVGGVAVGVFDDAAAVDVDVDDVVGVVPGSVGVVDVAVVYCSCWFC